MKSDSLRDQMSKGFAMRFSRQYLASRSLCSLSGLLLSKASLAIAVAAMLVPTFVSRPVRAQRPHSSADPADNSIKKVSKQGLKPDAPKIITFKTPDALDFRSSPAAYPARDGHLVLTSSADVWVPKNHYIELMPNATLRGFTAVALTVLENGLPTRVIGVERALELPIIRVYPPMGDCNRKRVLIVATDAVGNTRLIMQCVVRARLYGPAVTMNVQVQPETCTLSLENRDSLSAVYLYLDDLYLGRIGDTADTLDLDTNRLLPGTYHFRILAKNTDGVLLPEMRAAFTVSVRLSITGAKTSSSAIIEPEPANTIQLVRHVPRS